MLWVLAAMFGPAVLGVLVGLGVGGWLAPVLGAVGGLIVGFGGLGTVLTPWMTRAILADRGLRLHGSRWRGRVEVWDLPRREVTVVEGRLRRRTTTRRADRRETPPDPPRNPPYIPGLWPLPADQRDAPQVRRAMEKVRRLRAQEVLDQRARRGR